MSQLLREGVQPILARAVRVCCTRLWSPGDRIVYFRYAPFKRARMKALLVCFLLLDICGTATFFILMVMALIDVVAGFSISIFAVRRDYSVDKNG